jgi:mono/diheme cytochrome c family protein
LLSKIRFDVDRSRTVSNKSGMVATVSTDPSSSNSPSPTAQPVPFDTGNSKSIESVATGQKLFLKRGCFTCHGRAGAGGLAPALAPLVAQLSNSRLISVLEQPTDKMKAGGMPQVQLTSEEMEMLLSYLRSLPNPRTENQPAAMAVAPQ